MNDILTSGIIQSAKLLFQKKVERNVIIDPFSCLVKLSLLRFLETGTKISIYQNRIHFNPPSYIQGFVRFIYGDNREHLHNLFLPIQKSVEWFWDDKNENITYMFNNSIIGLKMLKYAYNEYATIQHTIDYYIIIMLQKNTQLISKIGINLLDIDKITNCMIECSIEKNTDKNSSTSEFIAISNDINNKNKNKKINNEEAANTSNAAKNNTINAKDIRESIQSNQIHTKDMHKFLFELWNIREIGIVINLYKEMESKQKGYERDNIYSNIMSYCSMKENKLFDYIQENSSVL